MKWKKKGVRRIGQRDPWLENLLKVTHSAYAETGIAKIEKVEPPTRYVKKKQGDGYCIVQMANPFVDYIGSTRGRAVAAEAKSTEVPRLSLLADNGITERQWAALVEWERHGAMSGVLWGFSGQVRFLSMAMMKEKLACGIKTIHWPEAETVTQGMGYVLNDWMHNLRASYNFPLTDPLTATKK